MCPCPCPCLCASEESLNDIAKAGEAAYGTPLETRTNIFSTGTAYLRIQRQVLKVWGRGRCGGVTRGLLIASSSSSSSSSSSIVVVVAAAAAGVVV